MMMSHSSATVSYTHLRFYELNGSTEYLEDAEMDPKEVDYINVHGTSTPVSYTHLDVYKRQVTSSLFTYLYIRKESIKRSTWRMKFSFSHSNGNLLSSIPHGLSLIHI